MLIWDSGKAATNLAKHGRSFESAADFDWETAVTIVDDRRDYGECRRRALGLFDGKLHAVVFTLRGETVRIISFRRANKRKERLYETLKKQ